MSQSNKRTIPLKISPEKNFERVTTSKKREYIKELVLRDQITQNAYEDSLIVDCRLFSKKIFEIWNKHPTNAIHYKILACLEPDSWHEIKSETSLAAATKTYEWDTEPWAYVKFQVKSETGGNAGKVTAIIGCQN